MPKCGSQIILCNVPIRFDTYKGCSHNCKYCFVYRKKNIADNIKKDECKDSLINFINGKRNQETSWCDWSIPLHWGGMSDPFQPCEREIKNSLECLEIFAKTKYPFIISTKSILPTEEPYYNLFKNCNCVYQCSMVCPSLCESMEKGAPSFEVRLNALEKMSKIVKRTIVRCQPYLLELHKEIMQQIPLIAKAGAYGIVFEAIKMQTKLSGLIKNGADYIYPKDKLLKAFLELKEECHKYGLVFLSGENRFRNLGDSLTCCGCEGLEGFEVNKSNLNYKIYKPEEFKYTIGQCKGYPMCFKAVKQDTVGAKFFMKHDFKEINEMFINDSKIIKNYLDI